MVKDTFLIGVMGDYNAPTAFMRKTQQMALIQLCAWLCYQNSISTQNIVPVTDLNPNSSPRRESLDPEPLVRPRL